MPTACSPVGSGDTINMPTFTIEAKMSKGWEVIEETDDETRAMDAFKAQKFLSSKDECPIRLTVEFKDETEEV